MKTTQGKTDNVAGFYLLEVLVAILILAFGLLGMLGLMVNSMKLTSTSNYRTLATQLSNTLADGVKSSLPMLASYNQPGASAVANCLNATGCAATSMVGTQIAVWNDLLSNELPSGAGVVCQDSSATITGNPVNWNCAGTATSPFVIKVCWDESRVGVNGTSYECVYTRL